MQPVTPASASGVASPGAPPRAGCGRPCPPSRNDPGPDRGREGGRALGSPLVGEPVRDPAWEGAKPPDLIGTTKASEAGLCAPAENLRINLWQTRDTVDAPPKGPILTDHDLVLVVDFGAQYAQLIARRVREAKVYSEIVPHSMPVAEMLARKPAAIVLSGGPSSVYAPGAPHVDADLFEAGVPVFGMCYGFQAMAQVLGGEVARTGISEFGRTPVRVTSPGTLLADIPAEHRVWMSHGDSVRRAPDGFDVLAADRGDAGGRLREHRASPRRRAVAPRGAAHRARPEGARALPATTSPAAGPPGRW